jgi:phosphohistidine phosphatase SixA
MVRVRTRLLEALVVLAALTAAGGCDLGSDDDDPSGKRQPEATEAASGPPVERLRRGGYVVALRHAATDPTATDMTGDLSDCSRQRNLNAEGRRQARAIGRAFRRLGIPVGRVLASPFCRTRDTARLAFGRVRPSRALLSADFFGGGGAADRQRAGLRRLLGLPPRRGTNTVLVSHEAAIHAATGVTVAEGESVIVAPRPGRRGVQIVSTVEASAWARAAPAER